MRLLPHATGTSCARARRGAGVSRARRHRAPEMARASPGGRRISAYAERKGPEVRAAPRVGRGQHAIVTALLDGMRVLDAGIWRPVPHATQMLADLGAQVLKIEPPGGDPMRT